VVSARAAAFAVALAAFEAPALAQSLASAAAASESVRRLRADVAYLASDALKGRRAGTPESDAAAAWVAESFRRIGLLPGATRGSYLQSFDFIEDVELGPGNRLTTGETSGERTWAPGTDFRPLAFSSPGAVSGEVVFAGYGIVAPGLSRDDYAGLDVKGRIVLVLRGSPDGGGLGSPFWPWLALREKASAARTKGAAALLVATGPRVKDAKDELVDLRTDPAFSDAGLPALAVKRAVAEALFAGSGRTFEDAQRILDGAKRSSPVALASHASLTADVTPRRVKTANVIGVLPGADATVNTDVIVVGAHYDHLGLGGAGSLEAEARAVHPGADDNASGVAGMLELARLCAAKRGTLRRSLLFIAFGAEEEGTLGSLHFTGSPTVPARSLVAMLNLDMVGRLRDGRLAVHGIATSPGWTPLLRSANEETGLKLTLEESRFGPSDHSPFSAAKIPALFFFTGVHDDYHRPSDTPDKLNYAGEAKVLGLLVRVVEGLANAPARIESVRKNGTLRVQPFPGRGPNRPCRKCSLSTALAAILSSSPGCWRGGDAPFSPRWAARRLSESRKPSDRTSSSSTSSLPMRRSSRPGASSCPTRWRESSPRSSWPRPRGRLRRGGRAPDTSPCAPPTGPASSRRSRAYSRSSSAPRPGCRWMPRSPSGAPASRAAAGSRISPAAASSLPAPTSSPWERASRSPSCCRMTSPAGS
jgi:Zn-dependent M28 family amino/carboxypeptidase